MKKVSIIGSGSWATALATVLTDNKIDVLLWSPFEKQVKEINKKHTNSVYFPDVTLNKKIKATDSLKEIVDFSDNFLMVVPTKYYRDTLKKINKLITNEKVFISASKGIEPKTFLPISEIIKQEINKENLKEVVILSGPSHAEEVIQKHLTLITAVCENDKCAKKVQKLFSNKYLRVYTNHDVLGVEICGSLKNVIAIASGIVHGMGYGDNTKAALITRGLAEMVRYGSNFDCDIKTFYGLAGVGDLIVTATSHHSRNFQAGLKIANGENIEDIIDRSEQVVEGARTAKAVQEQLKSLNIEMPILSGVYDILYKKKKPQKVIEELMNRDLKHEHKIQKNQENV